MITMMTPSMTKASHQTGQQVRQAALVELLQLLQGLPAQLLQVVPKVEPNLTLLLLNSRAQLPALLLGGRQLHLELPHLPSQLPSLQQVCVLYQLAHGQACQSCTQLHQKLS